MTERSKDIIKDGEVSRDNKGFGGVLQKAALVIWAALILLAFVNRDKLTVESILSFEPDSLLLAALMLMGLFALKTMSIVFYSGLLFTVSGMIFDLPAAIALKAKTARVTIHRTVRMAIMRPHSSPSIPNTRSVPAPNILPRFPSPAPRPGSPPLEMALIV